MWGRNTHLMELINPQRLVQTTRTMRCITHSSDDDEDDAEGSVEPVVMLATWQAYQQSPMPLDPECSGYDMLVLEYSLAFERTLEAIAPKLVEDLDGAIWGLHHQAHLRLAHYLQIDPTAAALKDIPPDLVYAVATTPYRSLESGRRAMCLDTLELKRLWYRRTQMVTSEA
jgi:hypothetical protein